MMSITDYNLSKGIFIFLHCRGEFHYDSGHATQYIKLKKITWYSAASLRSMIPAAGFPAMIEVGDLAFTAILNFVLKCDKIKIQG